MEWSWQVVYEVLPSMWQGLIVTVQATLVGALLAYVLGLVLALLKMSKTWIVAKTSYWISEGVRRTPLLVQLYFLFLERWATKKTGVQEAPRDQRKRSFLGLGQIWVLKEQFKNV